MTDAERQALIAQIQGQIAQLQAQISAQQTSSTTTPTTTWCHTFNTNLGYVNSGTDEVGNLHTVLQKQGIPYTPDSVNVYSTATMQAVKEFQLRKGISPQSGYVGPTTRAKLNQLYGCSSGTGTTGQTTGGATSCTPNWQTGSWSICTNNQQTRTVTDSNNCGVATNKPAISQVCTNKPIYIKANDSDGPVNIFLTLGNGASVSSAGINLSKSIELKWTGIDVSSCQASDSLNPQVFSGFKPSSGSQTVTMSGTIQANSTYSNKVSDTFRINCVVTETGANVNDSITVNLFYTVNAVCNPNWQCASWGDCTGSRQTRSCVDSNGCGSITGKPTESQSCVPPPTTNIKANYSDGPVNVASGGSVNLSWTSANAAYCTASGGWSGSKATSGSQTISSITSSQTFNIFCTNSAGVGATDSVSVNVIGQ